jgi:hypothetical protein
VFDVNEKIMIDTLKVSFCGGRLVFLTSK